MYIVLDLFTETKLDEDFFRRFDMYDWKTVTLLYNKKTKHGYEWLSFLT